MTNHQTLSEIIYKNFDRFPNHTAIQFRIGKDKDFTKITFAEFKADTIALASAFISLGIKPKDKIALIEDVGYHWLLSDFTIQLIGATDVPRGTDSTGDELGFILAHSESHRAIVATEEEIEKIKIGLKKHKGKINEWIVLDLNLSTKKKRGVYTLGDLLAKGRELVSKNAKEYKEIEKRIAKVKPADIATIVYTSGTTGEPKGVVLTQANFASQLNILPEYLKADETDRGLTLLPPWHVFGRIIEYVFFVAGASITYTDIKNIGEDFRNVKPTFVPAVPRIWEGVYNKIVAGVKKSGKEKLFLFFKDIAIHYTKAKNALTGKERVFVPLSPLAALLHKSVSAFVFAALYIPYLLGDILVFKKVRAATGGSMRGSVSGGGALPAYIDEFFSAVGVNILEGYGLTETTPVLSVRQQHNIVPGTVGHLIPLTEGKIIDADGNDVTAIPGSRGTLFVRGPQIMQGYYKNPKKTGEVLDKEGWLNTGDLVQFTDKGMMSIVGRSKDTIVLLGGENIEPNPIEDKLKEHPLVDHVMLVGQDKKTLGALLVPNEEELRAFCQANNLPSDSLAQMTANEAVHTHYKKIVQQLVSTANGFKSYEKITAIHLLNKPFEKGEELNNTMKLKRHVVQDMYAKIIDEILG